MLQEIKNVHLGEIKRWLAEVSDLLFVASSEQLLFVALVLALIEVN